MSALEAVPSHGKCHYASANAFTVYTDYISRFYLKDDGDAYQLFTKSIAGCPNATHLGLGLGLSFVFASSNSRRGRLPDAELRKPSSPLPHSGCSGPRGPSGAL